MLDALRRRLDAGGIRTATGRDALLGVAVAAATVAAFFFILRVAGAELGTVFGQEDLLAGLTPTGQAAACVVLVAQAMALTLRRRAPLLCLGLVLAGQLVLPLLLPPFVSFQAPAGLVAAYSVGAYGSRRTGLWAVGGAAVVQVLVGFVLGGAEAAARIGLPAGTQLGGDLVAALVVYLGAALVGGYVGARREVLAGLRAQVDQAEREREAVAARAVLEERGRMARELHDVAAHHLSGIVVQAAAAERLVDGDPDRAKESLRWIRAQGRETLANLRLVVGILRDSADPAGHDAATPQPTLADVPQLVDLARRAGSDVHEATHGEPFPLAPTVQLTVYRVLQEALSNARRHAPGTPVHVETSWTPDDLVLTVRNATAPDAVRGEPGHGVIGMRERAEFVGATLAVGPVPDGGWRVRLAVPRPAAVGVSSGPATAVAPEGAR